MLSSGSLQLYLEEINLTEESLRPSLRTLSLIQDRHTKSLPFANVTTARAPTQLIRLGFPQGSPDLSSDGLIEKLLVRKWYASSVEQLVFPILSARVLM